LSVPMLPIRFPARCTASLGRPWETKHAYIHHTLCYASPRRTVPQPVWFEQQEVLAAGGEMTGPPLPAQVTRYVRRFPRTTVSGKL
jgi:hypothetical protein